MKHLRYKLLLQATLFLVFGFGHNNLCAQEYKYIPLADSNAVWSEYFQRIPVEALTFSCSERFVITGEDTLHNGKIYKKLFVFYDKEYTPNNMRFLGGIREDSLKRVYYFGDTIHIEKPYLPNLKPEMLLYDFSLNVGDSIDDIDNSNTRMYVTSVDTIELGGYKRRRFSFSKMQDRLQWIEGIGSTTGLLFQNKFAKLGYAGNRNTLLCFRQNGLTVYFSPFATDCFPFTGLSENEAAQANLFPNPTTNQFTISVTTSTIKTVKIYSLTGQLVLENNLSNTHQNQINIDASLLKTGLYQCVIELANGQSSTQRLVKE